jgi:hypothetical protein
VASDFPREGAGLAFLVGLDLIAPLSFDAQTRLFRPAT